MKRPDGFDRGASPSLPEEDTQPTRQRPLRDARLRRRRTGEGAAPAEVSVTDATEQAPPAKPRSARSARPRREPTEAETAARKAREQAVAAKRDARRAAAERRRYERAEVRRFTRRARHRRTAWLTAGGVTVVLGSLIAVAVFSPLLALQEIRVMGTTRLDAQQVHDAVDGQLGTPLALLDQDQLTRDLSQFALIRSYVTETVPPHTLVIHVSERQPVASVLTDDGYLLVDPAGIEIERTETRPAGVPMMDVAEEEVGGDVFDATVEVLLALPQPLLAQVDQVSATTMDDVTLVLAGVGQRVVWGSADRSELKTRVLERLMAAHDPSLPVEFDVTAPLSAVVRPV